MLSSVVSVSGLRVDRGGREVLHGLTFDVPRGSVVGLLGPSGCGKTTLIRSVVGVQVVRSGSVTVLGAPHGDVDRVIDEVGLGINRHQVVATLSGGELSRASLAAALLGSPELLVLDEPTVGLDPVLRQELWELFHELADRGVTLIVSSHVMDEAARCGRLLLMRDRDILADDSPGGLRAATGTADLEAAFLHLIAERQEAHAS